MEALLEGLWLVLQTESMGEGLQAQAAPLRQQDRQLRNVRPMASGSLG